MQTRSSPRLYLPVVSHPSFNPLCSFAEGGHAFKNLLSMIEFGESQQADLNETSPGDMIVEAI